LEWYGNPELILWKPGKKDVASTRKL